MKECTECGNREPDDMAICPKCGNREFTQADKKADGKNSDR